MATPVVVHTSPPHSLLSMNVNRGAKLLSLPSIHPGQLVKTDDRDGLCRDDVKLQYSKSPSNLHKLASAKRSTCLPLPSVDLHTTAVTEVRQYSTYKFNTVLFQIYSADSLARAIPLALPNVKPMLTS